MHVWRDMLRLFGWVINRERHEEYKELLRENKRLRKQFGMMSGQNGGRAHDVESKPN